MIIKNKSVIVYLLMLITLCGVVSCTTSKQMVYLNNLNTDSIPTELLTAQSTFETLIQKNDLLWISVGGPNSQDLLALNSGLGIPGQLPIGGIASQNSQILGYLVEGDGTIKIPYVGAFKAEGLTRRQLEDTLKVVFRDYTKDPVVNVRFMNYKVTIMGEVQRPGSITVPNERITILEALGMAGDLTVMGQRESVLVVREVNGKREIGKVNLLSDQLFLSPYYYLRTNDVVYVKPAPARFFARERIPQFITLAASGLSLLLTAFTISKL